jgi:hypothetical protein
MQIQVGDAVVFSRPVTDTCRLVTRGVVEAVANGRVMFEVTWSSDHGLLRPGESDYARADQVTLDE